MSENYCPTCGPRRIYARTLAFYPDGPDLNRNTCLQCGRTLVSADATEKTKDAEIAALTERLRAVEAERDALIKDVLAIVPESIQPKVSGESPSWHAVAAVANLNARRLNHEADLSALRADLARKDGALKWYAEQVGQCAKFDAVPGGIEARAALSKDCGAIAVAALQPKEPPCQTA